MVALPADGDRVATVEHLFPVDILNGCETALVLFASAFGGEQDARYIADAGLRATCVDLNVKTLLRMQNDYPDDWQFIVADAYVFPRLSRKTWDVVTADPFTNEFAKAAGMLQAWCDLARRFVVLGVAPGQWLDVPTGWTLREKIRRSAVAHWAVLERA